MLERFKQDVQRWIVPQQVSDPALVTWRTTLSLLWQHMPLQAMFFFRLGSWLKQKRIPFFPSLIQHWIYFVYGLDIVIGQEIEGGLYIAHPISVVIAAEKIGRNCSIIASVTIGLRNEWAFPVIGDDVFIGAGARVLGGISIGDGARIGANAVVIDNVPPGATAVGIPARVIRKQDDRAEPLNILAPFAEEYEVQ